MVGQIKIQLSEEDQGTELTLIQTNVPESGEHYKKGCIVHYFQPMASYSFKSFN